MSILKKAANRLNKDAFKQARDLYQWDGTPVAYPDRRIVDLEQLASLLAKAEGIEKRQLWKLSHYGY